MLLVDSTVQCYCSVQVYNIYMLVLSVSCLFVLFLFISLQASFHHFIEGFTPFLPVAVSSFLVNCPFVLYDEYACY